MRDESIETWLECLASRSPTPGGGAVVGVCLAISAALVQMVTSYTTGQKWADREAHMRQLNEEAGRLRLAALDAVEDDVMAFTAVAAAYRLPKETADEKASRSTAIQHALVEAAAAPARAGEIAVRLVEIADELIGRCNPNVLSDVAVASSSARTAVEAAIVNIEVNRQQIKDEAETARLNSIVDEFTATMASADRIVSAIREQLK